MAYLDKSGFNKFVDELYEKTELIPSSGKHSCIIKESNNNAYSDYNIILGKDNNSGLKGFYYKNISPQNKYIYVSNYPTIPSFAEEDITENINCYQYEGQTITIVYDNISYDINVIRTNNGILEVDNIPFNMVENPTGNFYLYCKNKPYYGLLDLGNYSFIFGENNITNNINAFAVGNNNKIISKNNTIIGSNNIITGDNSLICGDNNNIIDSHSYVFGENNETGIYGYYFNTIKYIDTDNDDIFDTADIYLCRYQTIPVINPENLTLIRDLNINCDYKIDDVLSIYTDRSYKDCFKILSIDKDYIRVSIINDDYPQEINGDIENILSFSIHCHDNNVGYVILSSHNFIQGSDNKTYGHHTSILGSNNITYSNNEVAIGQYNKSNSDTVFSIGVGTKDNRKNALEVKKDGKIYIDGVDSDINSQFSVFNGYYDKNSIDKKFENINEQLDDKQPLIKNQTGDKLCMINGKPILNNVVNNFSFIPAITPIEEITFMENDEFTINHAQIYGFCTFFENLDKNTQTSTNSYTLNIPNANSLQKGVHFKFIRYPKNKIIIKCQSKCIIDPYNLANNSEINRVPVDNVVIPESYYDGSIVNSNIQYLSYGKNEITFTIINRNGANYWYIY